MTEETMKSTLIFLNTFFITRSWAFQEMGRMSAPISPLFASKDNQLLFDRRAVLASSAAAILLPQASEAATRAVGSGEIACRENNNCLETGEWDGAVGWTWGGKDRCDASDPLCGPDGKLRDRIVGKPVPTNINQITHVVILKVDIGREESGVLKLGLFGKDVPGSVQQLTELSGDGFTTLARNQNNMGASMVPVSLDVGGVVDSIVPSTAVDFGVPSQSYAYARSKGISKADGFVAQSRPDSTFTGGDGIPRSHDAAGLVSLPIKGLGYGGSGFESDDEAFESCFLITADALPSLDRNRRVVGQVLDSQSMAFLERLASLPTKRGIKGVIPGQTSGPPLLRTVVREAAVSKVTDPSSAPSS